jgi:hypothetical protein
MVKRVSDSDFWKDCKEKTDHEYEPQSKLWKPIRKLAAGYYTPAYTGSIQLTDITALYL